MIDMAFANFIESWGVNRVEKNQASLLVVEEVF
jgi:hypothetical protein